MSLRKEVFQAKVLQRLYPAVLNVKKTPGASVHHPHADKSSTGVQLQSSHAGVPVLSGRKVYTALPPPEDYIPASGEGLDSPTNTQAVSNADELAAKLSGSEDCSAAEDERPIKKRKRRRKRKPATPSEEYLQTAAADEEKVGVVEEKYNRNAEGSECHSKNKRRKMKKKRHKLKLLALGLVPRSTALEFTYKHIEDKEEKDEDRMAEDLLDFLHSTRELYLADHSHSVSDPSAFLCATDSLFTRLSDRTSPSPHLSILLRLTAAPLQSELEKLQTVLQEFTHTSTLPKDETEAIYTLCHYWITKVLPLRTEMKE